jgi:hypothetical protein
MRKIQELSDRELQEGMYRNIKLTREYTSTIKMWVVIFGLIVSISALLTIIPLIE